MSIAYLFCFLLINTNLQWVNYEKFYDFLFPCGEFFYRGSVGFFYKGFFFMCIGCIFWIFEPTKYSKYIIAIISLAIFLSFTRGFILAIILSLFFFYVLNNSKDYKKILTAIIISIFFLFFLFLGVFYLFCPFFIERSLSLERLYRSR